MNLLTIAAVGVALLATVAMSSPYPQMYRQMYPQMYQPRVMPMPMSYGYGASTGGGGLGGGGLFGLIFFSKYSREDQTVSNPLLTHPIAFITAEKTRFKQAVKPHRENLFN